MMKNKPLYIYKTDIRSILVILFFMFFGVLASLIPPINWSATLKGGGLLFLVWVGLYLFLRILSRVNFYSDGKIVASLMAMKKKTRVQNVTEIQRGPMYHGLSKVFGHQAFVMYRKEDGSTGYFEMSENLYSKKTMQALFKKLIEMNKDIKVDPYYKKLMDKKTFKWWE